MRRRSNLTLALALAYLVSPAAFAQVSDEGTIKAVR
jgi:hypothetical protein